MKPTQKSLKPHINNWVEDGLITQDQANSILAKYPVSSISPAVMTFSIIGGLLCVLGLILMISANWQSIPREVKLGGLLGLLAASTLLGAEGVRRKSYPAITEISYLFAAVLPLAGLVMVSQFFNISGSGFMLVLTWFLSILFLPFLSLSSSAFVVWLLALSALISLAITEHHWMLLDSEDHTLLAVAGVWGVVLAAGSQLWSKIGGTMQRSWGEALGLIMTSQALYAYDLSIFDFSNSHTRFHLWEILWGGVFVLNLIAVFCGYKFGRRHLVTIGLITIGIVLLSFYLRLAGSMLSTGMLFLTAGTLLLILICAIHKLRKSLLS